MLDQIELDPARPFGLFWIIDSLQSCKSSNFKAQLTNLSKRSYLCITTIGIGNDHDANFLNMLAN